MYLQGWTSKLFTEQLIDFFFLMTERQKKLFWPSKSCTKVVQTINIAVIWVKHLNVKDALAVIQNPFDEQAGLWRSKIQKWS